MKNVLFSSIILASTALAADGHDFSVGTNFNTGAFNPLTLDASYVNTRNLQEGTNVFLGAFGRSLGDKTYHAEASIGFRDLVGKSVVFGVNYCHEITNVAELFNHAAHPGLEFLFPGFSLAFSHQIPIKKEIKKIVTVYSYHRTTTVTLSIPFMEKYEIKFVPYYIHKKDVLGIEICGSAQINDNISVSATPYYESTAHRGVYFGLNFDFGAPSTKRNKGINKLHQFTFSSEIVKPTIRKKKPAIFIVETAPRQVATPEPTNSNVKIIKTDDGKKN